jgi:aspartate racemase
MKTIGALGGLGPQATMDFEARLHTASQRLVPQSANSGYPPLVVYYHRFVPWLETEPGSGVPADPIQPHPRLVEAAAKIGELADFVVITCNYLHLFQREIEEAAGCEVLSMIDLVLAEARRRGWQRVGVPGFREPTVYLNAMAGFDPEVIEGELRENLNAGILEVMEGRNAAAAAAAGEAMLTELRGRGVDGIVLGCTEIPFLVGPSEDTINPIELLAEAAVERALA